MKYLLLVMLISLASCSSYIYVVRHAEKATAMGNNTDVPLNENGKARAIALKDSMMDRKIAAVYSTNTIRTRSTAEPTADYFHLPVISYGNPPDSVFISTLRHSKKNTLVVGHSNTVDDIVNRICGEKLIPGDLGDPEYDNLFVIRKRGMRFELTKKRYGVSGH